ncbi:MAG: fasciclin domain-containing protein [Bacteroidia bacterium]|nr:fasciclin domain-containing protein [Bacteroidia bacterium]
MLHLNRTLLSLLAASLLLAAPGCLPREPEYPTLVERLADPKFDRIRVALDSADFIQELDGSFYFTILCPTNEAFDAWLASKGYASIAEVPKTLLINTLNYHFQLGKIRLQDYFTTYVTTPAPAFGKFPIVYQVNTKNGIVTFNQSAKIIEGDILADDGVLHRTDKMLELPTVMSLLEIDEDLSILVEAIDRAKLRTYLSGPGPLTLFAAPNDVFEQYFDDEPGIASLSDMNDDQVRALIEYHILDRNLRNEDLAGSSIPVEYTTANPSYKIQIENAGSVIFINDSIQVALMDLQCTNGVIHIVGDVLEYE